MRFCKLNLFLKYYQKNVLFLRQLKTFYQPTTEAFAFTNFVNRELAIVLIPTKHIAGFQVPGSIFKLNK